MDGLHPVIVRPKNQSKPASSFAFSADTDATFSFGATVKCLWKGNSIKFNGDFFEKAKMERQIEKSG